MEPAQAWRAVSNSETMEQARRFHSPSTDWGCGLADRGGGLLFVRNVCVGERDFQILEDGQIVDQVITLENKADIRLVQFIALFDIEFVYRLIQKVVFTVPRAVEHADNAEQRGFSRAGRPHERDELARKNVQRDAPQNKKFASAGLKGLLEIAHLYQRFHKLSLMLKWARSSVRFATPSLYS